MIDEPFIEIVSSDEEEEEDKEGKEKLETFSFCNVIEFYVMN